jgi:tetratricopeptide (TPR) repeat protein
MSNLLTEAPERRATPTPAPLPPEAEAHHQAGIELVRQGHCAEAIPRFRKALDLAPAALDVRHNLAVALARDGQFDEAIAHLEQVLQANPDGTDALGNLGLACAQAGKPHEALAAYRRLLALRPDNQDARHNLANLLRNQGEISEAVDCYRQLLQARPDAADVWHNLGLAHAQERKPQEALANYREALRLKPEFPEAFNNMGILLEEQGNYEEAVTCFREALRLRPLSAETLSNLGVALAGQGKSHEALAYYYEALRVKPGSPEAHNNLGNALRAEGLVEESIRHHRQALELKPDYAEAFNNVGISYVQLGDFQQALACYDEAVRLKPDYADAHMNRSLAWLGQGDYARGWREYEWRWRGRNLTRRSFPQPAWDGGPLAGRTLLLYTEQGLGDTLQFVRYAPLLQARGATIFLEAPRPLLPLLSRCAGIDRLLAQGEPLPAFDLHAPLLSLPRLLGTTLATVPASIPYLHADPTLIERWRGELARLPGLKVGIAWQGSPQYKGDRFRSIPLHHFGALARVPGVTLIPLQKGPGVEQLDSISFPVTRLGPLDEATGPFMDTAAVLSGLDLCVSCDSAVAHLAGALGVRTWLALAVAPDWRWLRGRNDSPWYPSLRLFRQPRRGDWHAVFDLMARQLPKLESGSVRVSVPTLPPRGDAELLHKEGVAAVKQGRLDEAVGLFRQALEVRPDFVAAHHNLAVAFAKNKRFAQAVESFQRALRLSPGSVDAHGNLGLAYLEHGEPEQAVAHLSRAVELRPGLAEPFNNLGVALMQLSKPQEAAEAYQRALALEPTYAEAHANLARSLLIQGDFERGGPEYEWRWRCKDAVPRSLPQPAWDGGPLEGRTILLYAEQGLGDTLQFVRYAPLLQARGATVLLEAPRQLLPLLSRCAGIHRLLAQGEPLPAFDVHSPLLSLPRLLGTTLATVPAHIPYLHADPALSERWRSELARLPGFKVGIVWQGNPSFSGDRFRSVSLHYFGALARVPGVTLIPLQKGPGVEQLDSISFAVTRLGPLDEATGPFMDTAAVLAGLDLCVSCDSAVAHLAGGLGVPTWLALAFAPDWRWLRGRQDSPWYPSLRLFRQPRRGDWQAVFDDMARQLARFALEKEGKVVRVVPWPESSGTALPSRPDDSGESSYGKDDQVRGLELLKQGNCEEAVQCLQRAVVSDPLSSEAHHNLGVALARLGRLKEAVVSFGRALERAPDSPDALGNLGLAHLQLGNTADAIPAFRRALALRPHSAETLNNFGVALARQQELDQAIQAYRDALRLRPDYVDAHNNLGNAYRSRDQHDEALACYREALRLNPEAAEVHNNLGITLAHLGKAEEAVAAFRDALRRRPDFAEANNNLGVTLADSNRLHEAVAAFSDALRVRPEHAETHRNRALAWLLLGDYEQGWPEYEWRWRCENSARRPFPQPLWDGSPLESRTILLHAEQGLGDTLQFMRFAPLVRQQGGVVILECQPPLLRLLLTFSGADRVVPQGGPLPRFDVQVPLMSLPTVLRTTLATVPAEVPYLSADPNLVDYWRGILDGLRGFKVGIAWQGSPKYGGDRHRSISLEHFARLAEVPGVRLISLQKGPGAEQIGKLSRRFPLVDLDRQLDNAGAFVDSAAVVKNLDLVITCDTAVGHLAGALGVPVWVVLCCPCDWRWMRDREDSPWYPSVRLFRQRRWGDWEDVFARIAAELAVAAAGSHEDA